MAAQARVPPRADPARALARERPAARAAHEAAEGLRGDGLRVARAVFTGSSGDNCITPPLSSVFHFEDADSEPRGGDPEGETEE